MTATPDGTGGGAEHRPLTPGVALPARMDMKRAFDIYVAGRNRTLGPEEKSGLAGGRADAPFAEPPASPVPVVDGAKVAVPAELRYDRNAGTWRTPDGPSKGGAR